MAESLSCEPSGASQLCGYQLAHDTWSSPAAYCGEFKADGLYFCAQHHKRVSEDYEDGVVRMAPGNVRGHLEWQTGTPGRPVPRNSGEAAIYSVEYLTKREGNALGTEPFQPRLNWLPG